MDEPNGVLADPVSDVVSDDDLFLYVPLATRLEKGLKSVKNLVVRQRELTNSR